MNAEEWYKKKYGVSPSKENQVMIDVGDILELQEEFAEYHHTQKTKELIEWVKNEIKNYTSYEKQSDCKDLYRDEKYVLNKILTKIKEDLNE